MARTHVSLAQDPRTPKMPSATITSSRNLGLGDDRREEGLWGHASFPRPPFLHPQELQAQGTNNGLSVSSSLTHRESCCVPSQGTTLVTNDSSHQQTEPIRDFRQHLRTGPSRGVASGSGHPRVSHEDPVSKVHHAARCSTMQHAAVHQAIDSALRTQTSIKQHRMRIESHEQRGSSIDGDRTRSMEIQASRSAPNWPGEPFGLPPSRPSRSQE